MNKVAEFERRITDAPSAYKLHPFHAELFRGILACVKDLETQLKDQQAELELLRRLAGILWEEYVDGIGDKEQVEKDLTGMLINLPDEIKNKCIEAYKKAQAGEVG